MTKSHSSMNSRHATALALAGCAKKDEPKPPMTHVRITITGREVTQRRRNAVVTARIGPKAIARTIANGGTTKGFSEMIRRFLSRSSTISAVPLTSTPSRVTLT